MNPSSNRVDRIVKVREYAGVPSILRYLMVETATRGVTMLNRPDGSSAWINTPLTEDDAIDLPEIDTTLSVASLYADVDMPPEPPEL